MRISWEFLFICDGLCAKMMWQDFFMAGSACHVRYPYLPSLALPKSGRVKCWLHFGRLDETTDCLTTLGSFGASNGDSLPHLAINDSIPPL